MNLKVKFNLWGATVLLNLTFIFDNIVAVALQRASRVPLGHFAAVVSGGGLLVACATASSPSLPDTPAPDAGTALPSPAEDGADDASGDGLDAGGAADAPAEPDSGPATAAAVVTIVTGLYHSCVLDAASAVFCWGGNQFGQLGDGKPTVAQPTPVHVSGLSDAVVIGAGNIFTCALRKTGAVVCWGDNFFGQIGDGTNVDRDVPTPVSGLVDATKIAIGGGHACAIRAGGAVECWGDDYYGQLGDGATGVERRTPVVAAAPADVVELAVGVRHTCALRATGEVACWGGNSSGQLGDGTVVDRPSPTQVVGITDAVEVSAGYLHTCARRATGAVMCWGRNNAGQLGDDSTTERRSPVAVSGLVDAVAISARDSHTCALRATGEVACWGDNSYGQLGDGNSGTTSKVPLTASGVTDATGVAAGNGHTCASSANGQARCWGENSFGQIGDGSTVTRTTATSVALP